MIGSLFFVSPAFAFETECDPDDDDLCSTPVVAGELVPYDGQLLTPKLAISLGQKAASFDIRLQLELDRAEELWKLDLELEKEKHRIDNEACDKKVDLLTKELKEAQNQPWYTHPAFVIGVTVVLTLGLVYGAAYVIQSL